MAYAPFEVETRGVDRPGHDPGHGLGMQLSRIKKRGHASPASTITATRTCPINRDIHFALIWSHMHSRGIGFVATTDDPTVAGDLYSTTTWSEPQARVFPDTPAIVVHAGSTVTYSCTYQNATANSFVQGPSARTNEMCILHGMYWPRMDSASELCLSGTSSMGEPIAVDDAGPADDAGGDDAAAADDGGAGGH